MRRIPLAVLVVACVAVFARLAYPTITWFDGSSYPLVAATFGVTSPPGSLILSLLGWPFTKLGVGIGTAFTLNLVAALLATLTVGLVYAAALRLLRMTHGRVASVAVTAAVAAGALTLAFSDTLLEYSGRFTPYILTTVFTGLILIVMLRWWERADEPDSWRLLALLALLFGLDFSVHRTNALLMPGAFAWILIRRPGALVEPRAVISSVAAMVVGLAVQLLVIPIAKYSTSVWNADDASTWSRFWSYITLERYGGVYMFPRKSPFWSSQVADFLGTVRDNFLDGALLGAIPGVLVVVGLVMLWRRERRLAVAYLCVVGLHAFWTVLFFNIPANFFRSFDRHYLPVCIVLAVPMAYGCGALVHAAATWRATIGRRMAIATAAVIAMVPASRLAMNWRNHDSSRTYVAEDFARNVLTTLPPNAIFFSYGDNDLFPMLYMQAVEGVRRDVTVINLSALNMPMYVERLVKLEPTLPFTLSADQRNSLPKMVPWKDSTIVVPVEGTAEQLGLTPGTLAPTSVTFVARVDTATGGVAIRSELLQLDLIRGNRWRRPITFSPAGPQEGLGFFAPLGRFEGMYYRLMPMTSPPPDVARMRANLLAGEYRGWADLTVNIDGSGIAIGGLYFQAFRTLADTQLAGGDLASCSADQKRLLARVPPERFSQWGSMNAPAC